MKIIPAFLLIVVASLVATKVNGQQLSYQSLRFIPAQRREQAIPNWPSAFLISHGDWCMTAKVKSNGIVRNGDAVGIDKCDTDNVST